MDFETARFNMIEQQIRPWDVLDPNVLDACGRLHREQFVPDAYTGVAFTDTEIPLGHGQFMMAPKVEARLLQALSIRPVDRILQIGTGSGYLTALLATLGAHVTAIELFEDLSNQAQAALRRAAITNIKLHIGDGLDGWSTAEPYDVVVIGGSLPARRPLIEQQMSLQGRLFAVIGTAPVMEATLITRLSKTRWSEESLFETELMPLIGAETKPEFKF